VVASSEAGSVTVGSGLSGVIVCTPEPILKLIVSKPGVALASRIACRSDPVPLSFVFVTVKVAAVAVAQRATSNTSVVNVVRNKQARRGMCLSPSNPVNSVWIMFYVDEAELERCRGITGEP
jgi:hypothetical protein